MAALLQVCCKVNPHRVATVACANKQLGRAVQFARFPLFKVLHRVDEHRHVRGDSFLSKLLNEVALQLRECKSLALGELLEKRFELGFKLFVIRVCQHFI